MKSTIPIRSGSSGYPVEALTIRMAVSADAAALGRLAELDSAPRPGSGPMLVAEVGGELRAALPLDGGRAIADPFRPTAELVAVLVGRARQLQASAPRRAAPRWGLLRALRAAPVPRA
jgi:hypothetical protein